MTKATIGITTYNLDKYIAEAIESLLAQKTNFKYKILIVDDASKDNTQKILKKYKEQYPDKIELIFKEKNEGSLCASNLLFDNIKTEYFSFLDGDDYWIDENRLQDAIDFLDKNPNYSMHGGNTYVLNNNQLNNKIIETKYLNKTFTYQDYKSRNCPFVHTSAIVLRNSIYKNGVPQAYKDNENTVYNCVFRGEDVRFVEHLKIGKIYVSNKNYSVYRIHEKGMWQGASNTKKILETALTYLKRIESYPEDKEFYLEQFCETYSKINSTLIQDKNIDIKYNLSDKEHSLYIGLLNELHNKKINWIKPQNKKIKKLKYKFLYFVYKILQKKLLKKDMV